MKSIILKKYEISRSENLITSKNIKFQFHELDFESSIQYRYINVLINTMIAPIHIHST